MKKFEKMELLLLAAVLGLLTFAVLGPPVAQPAHQHAFADQRVWRGVPFAMDVLSNLPFAVWGLAGLGCLAGLMVRVKLHAQHLLTDILAGLFFGGLVLTAVGSSVYHWQPNDVGLSVDRLGMVVAFAGLLGLAVSGRVSPRAGAVLALAVLLLGPLSIWLWLKSGNVLPWLALQFGGMALILWMAFAKPLPGALNVRWGAVVLLYAFAKLFELADHPVYELTAHHVSGHSLKHVVASFAASPVLAALTSALGIEKNQGRIHVTNSRNSDAQQSCR